jgi:hypothetical protein
MGEMAAHRYLLVICENVDAVQRGIWKPSFSASNNEGIHNEESDFCHAGEYIRLRIIKECNG